MPSFEAPSFESMNTGEQPRVDFEMLRKENMHRMMDGEKASPAKTKELIDEYLEAAQINKVASDYMQEELGQIFTIDKFRVAARELWTDLRNEIMVARSQRNLEKVAKIKYRAKVRIFDLLARMRVAEPNMVESAKAMCDEIEQDIAKM